MQYTFKEKVMNNYLKEALKIGELAESLYNISHDDNKNLEDYTQKEIVDEAIYVLSTFYENGHNNNTWLIGEWDLDPKDAKKEVAQLKKLIKKFG